MGRGRPTIRSYVLRSLTQTKLEYAVCMTWSVLNLELWTDLYIGSSTTKLLMERGQTGLLVRRQPRNMRQCRSYRKHTRDGTCSVMGKLLTAMGFGWKELNARGKSNDFILDLLSFGNNIFLLNCFMTAKQ